MNKKKIIFLGMIVVIAAIFIAFMFSSPTEDANSSSLDILGNGTIGENGTLNVKLSNDNGVALKDKEVHVTVKDSKGKVVFEKSAKTYVNGVANVKIENVSPGTYEVNVTFDGDEKYSPSSVSEKLIIAEGIVEEDTTDDNNATDDNVVDDTSSADSTDSSAAQTQSRSSSSHSQSSSSRYPSSSSSDGGSSDNYYDEDGNSVDPIIDENGNPTYDEE